MEGEAVLGRPLRLQVQDQLAMVLRTEIPMVMVTQMSMGTVTTAGRQLGTSNLNIQITWRLRMAVSNVCLSAMKTLNVPNRPGLIATTMNGSVP
jgi:hypothetical protein